MSNITHLPDPLDCYQALVTDSELRPAEGLEVVVAGEEYLRLEASFACSAQLDVNGSPQLVVLTAVLLRASRLPNASTAERREKLEPAMDDLIGSMKIDGLVLREQPLNDPNPNPFLDPFAVHSAKALFEPVAAPDPQTNADGKSYLPLGGTCPGDLFAGQHLSYAQPRDEIYGTFTGWCWVL